MERLSVLNSEGNRDAKLQLAFKIQDFDGDGKINLDDLTKYYRRIIEFAGEPLADEEASSTKHADPARELGRKVLEEVSEGKDHITIGDFRRVVAPSDFDSRLFLHL